MNKKIISTFVCFIAVLDLLSQVTVDSIIINSKNFYQKKSSGIVSIKYIFKSAIAERVDTNFISIQFSKNEKKIQQAFSNNSFIKFQKKKEYYFIDIINKSYSNFSSVGYIKKDFFDELKQYPFWSTGFYSSMKQKKLKLDTAGTTYHLYDNESHYYINKNDFSLKRYKNTLLSSYGIQIKEWFFLAQELSGSGNPSLFKEAETYLKAFKKNKNKKETVKPENIIGKPFFTYLGNTKLLSINLGEVDIKNRKDSFLLVDFFYQSCLPCIDGFEHLKQLKKKYDTTGKLFIIGFDPILKDSTNMLKFIKRYNLTHPVFVNNEITEFVSKFKKTSGYPMYVLVNNDGIIVDFQEGTVEVFFARVDKILDNTK